MPRLIDADAMVRDLLTVDPQYKKRIDWCIRIINAQPTIEPKRGEWIPCSERLPENGKPYLVLQEYDGHYWNQVLEYNDGWNCTKDSKKFEIDCVIAWMPLPAPPTISKKEQVERSEP